MSEPIVIDTKMHGLEGITGTFLLAGERSVLIETGPKSSVDNVLAGLEREGVDELDHIIVTHIHLDHAGATGTLVKRFPRARVSVHRVGAPHLVDPSKLWSSAARIYGDAMDRMWGGIDAVPAGNIDVVDDGDVIDLGDRKLTAIDTPGHAGHHHCYLDDATGIVFTGDALGVSPKGIAAFRPATPPPEFNLEQALGSIQKIRRADPQSVWLTHFGPPDAGVDEACISASDALNQWAVWVERARTRSTDLDEVTAEVTKEAKGELEAKLSAEDATRMENTTSYRMNVSGYMRYFDKKQKP